VGQVFGCGVWVWRQSLPSLNVPQYVVCGVVGCETLHTRAPGALGVLHGRKGTAMSDTALPTTTNTTCGNTKCIRCSSDKDMGGKCTAGCDG